ncbi:MAG: hypothetical protein IJK56_01000 [Firmicutes bacterium]|nr:hypothetical protein [Bacillota bacterium]
MRITLPRAESTLIDRQCISTKSQNIPPPLENSTFIPAPDRKSGAFYRDFLLAKIIAAEKSSRSQWFSAFSHELYPSARAAGRNSDGFATIICLGS